MEAILGVVGGFAITLVGVIMRKFGADVSDCKIENKQIKENYISKFDKVNYKLDELKTMLYELDKKLEVHISKTEGDR